MRIRSASTAGGLVVAFVLLSGCTAAGSVTAPPSRTAGETSDRPSLPADAAMPTPGESGCVSIAMSKDYGDYVIAGMHVHGTLAGLQFASEDDVAAGATTVVADVVSFGPGILSAVDGSTFRRSTLVFTPVVVQVSEVVRGEASEGSATILLEGGTAGCVTEWLDVAPRITAGTRYLLFLSPAYAADFKTLLGPLQIQFAWPVGADDVVQTPTGPIPLADLIVTIRKLPSTTPAPSAGS